MSPTDRVWLFHADTGGYFHCPADAAADWAENGWTPVDSGPEEVNPQTAEMPKPVAAEPAAASRKPRAGSSTEGSDPS